MRGGSSQLLLKGTTPPFGSNDPLRASPRMYPWELQGSRRGLSLTALPPRALGERCCFCLPSSSPSLPFWEPAGLGGGGEGVSVGIRVSEPTRPFGPSAETGVAPGNPRPEMGPTPACELFSGLSRLCSRQPREEPPWLCEQVPHGAGCRPASRCGPAAEGAAKLVLAPGLTDVREEKGSCS